MTSEVHLLIVLVVLTLPARCSYRYFGVVVDFLPSFIILESRVYNHSALRGMPFSLGDVLTR